MKNKGKGSRRRRQRQAPSPTTEGFSLSQTFSYVKSFGIALILALLLKHFVIEAFRIPTASMETTIMVGDFLIANKFIYGIRIPFTDFRIPFIRDPKQGDIVIFKYPRDLSQNYVKRCIAEPGQTVELKNKEVYVDGVLYRDDDFTQYSSYQLPNDDYRVNWGPYRVPPDHFFMMGDNRDNSSDSRVWGSVPREYVLGKAMFLHWSWKEDPDAPNIRWNDPITIIHSMLYNFLHFYDRVDWNRLGKAVR